MSKHLKIGTPAVEAPNTPEGEEFLRQGKDCVSRYKSNLPTTRISAEREKYKDIRTSKHFPTVKFECREVAAKFFYCFSKASQMVTENVRCHDMLIFCNI